MLIFPCFHLLELTCLSQVIQELCLVGISIEVCHEVWHGSAIDVIVTSYTPHVCREDSFGLGVVSDQLSSVKQLNRICYFVQQNHVSTWIHLQFIVLNAINSWILLNSLKEKRLFEPLDSFSNCSYCSRWDFCVNAVFKSFEQMTLNALLVGHHFNIFVHDLVLSQDDTLSLCVELWSSSSSENLLDVEDANIFVATCSWIIYFSSFDKDSISWQVHTPSKGCGWT